MHELVDEGDAQARRQLALIEMHQFSLLQNARYGNPELHLSRNCPVNRPTRALRRRRGMHRVAYLRRQTAGTLDVGYVPAIGLGDVSDLVLTCRGGTSLAIAVRHDHRLAAASSETVADLADENLVVYAADEDDDTVLTRWETVRGEHRARIPLVSSTLSALALAVAGRGVAVVPALTAGITLPELVYRPLDGVATGVDVMAISWSDELSGPVRAFFGRDPSRHPQ